MNLSEALKIAEDAGVDLIEISPNSNPPVVKVVDWGKYQYQKMKEQQKNRKHAKVAELMATDYSDELMEEMGKLQEELDHEEGRRRRAVGREERA